MMIRSPYPEGAANDSNAPYNEEICVKCEFAVPPYLISSCGVCRYCEEDENESVDEW